MMLAYVAPSILAIGVLVGLYSAVKSRDFRIYRYLFYVFAIHTIVGFMWTLYTALMIIGEELYRSMWCITFVGSVLFAIELVVFTHGNIEEVLKKFLPGAIMLCPFMILFVHPYVFAIYITPGIAIAIGFTGFVVALIIELIYSASRVYSIMREGKIFYLWRRIMLLAVWYVIYGLTYSIVGVLTMSRVFPYELANLMIAVSYLIKSILMFGIVSYYHEKLEPLLSKLG